MHPITALVLRREKNAVGQAWVLFNMQMGAVLLLVLFPFETWAAPFKEMLARQVNFLTIIPLFISVALGGHGYFVHAKKDPLYFSTMSRREIWIGFFRTAVLGSLSVSCTLELFVSYLYVFEIVPVDAVIVQIPLAWFFGIPLAAAAVSMNVSIRTTFQRVIIFSINVLSLWIVIGTFFVVSNFPYHTPAPSFMSVIMATLLNPSGLGAIGVFSWTACWFTAWRLFEFNLCRNRSFLLKLTVTILSYGVLAAMIAGLAFLLAYLPPIIF